MVRQQAYPAKLARLSRPDRNGSPAPEHPVAGQAPARDFRDPQARNAPYRAEPSPSSFAAENFSASSSLDETGPPVGIAEFSQILRRRWKTIAATTALVTCLGLAYAFLARPQFTAATSIFVDPRNRASFQIEQTGTGAGYDPNLVDSQIVLIESEAVLQRVIEAEKLLDDAEFTRGPGNAAFNVLRNLKEAVKVKRPDRTYVVEIQVRTQEAAKSARIANAIARAYLSDGRDSKSETANREQNWLETHIRNLQSRLKEAEARVEAYKVENKILGVEGKLVGEQQLSELNRGIVEAQRKASEARAVLDQVEILKKNGKLADTTLEALKSPTIERLRGQMAEITRLEANARTTLGPRHPAAIEVREQLVETRRLISEELARIAEGARSNFAVAKGNVTGLERQLDALKRDATGINRTLLRLRELERAVDAQKAVYEKFLRDKEQIARLSVDTPAGRVIAPAIAPQIRSFPNRPLILALAMAAGLFLGVGLALVLETLSRARRPPPRSAATTWSRETWSRPTWSRTENHPDVRASGFEPETPAPPDRQPATLAMLPPPIRQSRLRWLHASGTTTGGSKAPIALDAVDREPNSPYAREVTRLAARISDMVGDETPVTVMISGARPHAGNPALTINLARALAGFHRNVVLVDGTGARDGLTANLAGVGTPVEIDIAGQPHIALRLPTSGRGAIHFLPFGGVHLPRSGKAVPRAAGAALVLIDGPSLDSKEFERIDVDHRIDGVIAVLPAGSDATGPLGAALDQRFGAVLMGVVGQAA